MKKTVFLVISAFILFSELFGQTDSSIDYNKRLKIVLGTEIAAYTISMTGLYSLWYKNYDQSGFHFFNDNQEWMGMDKVGHFMTSYYLGMLGKEALEWAGVSGNKSVWYGGTLGSMFLTTVEVFDGFSAGWGASTGDLIANFAGSGLFIGQELLWDEQRITAKFSYTHSQYAQHNPSLLGQEWNERVLKDYNGQTYWLSFNLRSFFRESKMPEWLALSVGYGADGMTTSFDEIKYRPDGTQIPYFDRYSQFYLAPDIDLFRIKTRSKFLNTTFKALGFIKFPAPTLLYSPEKGLKAYWIFF